MARTIAATIQLLGITQAIDSMGTLKKQLAQYRAELLKTSETDPKFEQLKQKIGATEAALARLKKEQRAVTKSFEEQAAVPGSYNALRLETQRLTEQFKNLSVGVNTSKKDYEALAERIKQNNLRLTQMNRTLRGSKSIGERFRESMVKSFKQIAFQIGAAVSVLKGFQALKGLSDLGFEIERGFAQVNTVAQLTKEELAVLKADVLDVARTSSVELNEVPTALFNIVSATGDVVLSQEILAVSLKASKAGFSDVNTTAEAGVGIYNAVKDQVEDITEVYDILFRTQKEGVLTFQDLASNIPKVIPSANKAGFAFKEVAGALATITKSGVQADQASTFLDRALNALGDPKRVKDFKKLGVAVFDARGQTRSLVDIFTDLDSKLNKLNPEGKAKALSALGLDARAAKGVSILTENLETLQVVTDSVVKGSAEGQGELARQFAASANSADDQKAAWNDLKVLMLEGLKPAFDAISEGIIGFVRAILESIKFLAAHKELLIVSIGLITLWKAQIILSTIALAQNTIVRIANTIAYEAGFKILVLSEFAASAYAAITGVLTGKIALSTAATWARVAAQRALNLVMKASPVGLLVAGATALAGALILTNSATEEATRLEEKRAKNIKFLNEKLSETKKAIGEELGQSETLFRALRKENVSRDEKKKIVDEILSQYGDLLSNMQKEALRAGKIEEAYLAIRDAIIENIIAKKKQEAIDTILGEEIEGQLDIAERIGSQTDKTAQEVLKLARAYESIPDLVDRPVNLQLGIDGDPSEAVNEAFEKANKEFLEGLSKTQKEALGFIDGLYQAQADLGPISVPIEITDAQGNKIEDFARTQTVRDVASADQAVGELSDLFGALRKTEEEFENIEKRFGALAISSNTKIKPIGKDFDGVGDGADEAAKKAENLAKIIEENYSRILALRKQLADLIIENVEDETERELAQEEERFTRKLQIILNKSAEIIAAEGATGAQIAEAGELQNKLIRELEIQHFNKLKEIQDKADKEAEKKRKEAEEEELETTKRILDLRLDTVEKEIDIADKDFRKKKAILQKRFELQVRILEFETKLALAAAKTEEERTEIMRNHYAERAVIVRDFQEEVKKAREDEGPLLVRILGISEEELEQFKELFTGFLNVFNEALDDFFERRSEAIVKALEATEDRIKAATDKFQNQRLRLAALEEKLDTATGARRQNLIALIERERVKENQFHDEKVRNEKIKADLERKKLQLEKEAAKARKAQGIAGAIINTAVGITKTIAEVPKADFGVTTAILIGLYAALGAAQVALISGQKAEFGMKLSGPAHSDPEGGVPIVIPSQGRAIMAEGDEWIINKRASNNNDALLERVNREGAFTKFDLVPSGGFPVSAAFEDGGRLIPPDFNTVSSAVEPDAGSLSLDLLTLIATNQERLLEKESFISIREFRNVEGGVRAVDRRSST